MKTVARAVLMTACAMAASSASAQVIITQWNFNNLPVAVNNSPAPNIGSGQAIVLGMDNTYGTPNASQANADVLIGDVGSSDPIQSATERRSWRVRGGPVPGGGNANGWSSQAPQYTQGAQFNVSTVGFTGIRVSFDLQTTTQGPRNWQLQYTVDGTGWINAGAVGTSIGADAWNNNNVFDFGSLGITAVENNPLFGIRIVSAFDPTQGIYLNNQNPPAPLNNSSGNWRYDMITVTGIPTPGVAATLAMGGLLGLRRRR